MSNTQENMSMDHCIQNYSRCIIHVQNRNSNIVSISLISLFANYNKFDFYICKLSFTFKFLCSHAENNNNEVLEFTYK